MREDCIFWAQRRRRPVAPAEAEAREDGVSEGRSLETGGGADKRSFCRVEPWPGCTSRVQLEASIFQSFFFKICKDGLCGLVWAANGPVVEVVGRHVHRTVADSVEEFPRCRPVVPLFSSGFSLVRTRRSCRASRTGHTTWLNRAQLDGRRARNMTCRSGWTRSPSPWSDGILIRRCCGTKTIMVSQPLGFPNPNCAGGRYSVMSSETLPARLSLWDVDESLLRPPVGEGHLSFSTPPKRHWRSRRQGGWACRGVGSFDGLGGGLLRSCRFSAVPPDLDPEPWFAPHTPQTLSQRQQQQQVRLHNPSFRQQSPQWESRPPEPKPHLGSRTASRVSTLRTIGRSSGGDLGHEEPRHGLYPLDRSPRPVSLLHARLFHYTVTHKTYTTPWSLLSYIFVHSHLPPPKSAARGRDRSTPWTASSEAETSSLSRSWSRIAQLPIHASACLSQWTSGTPSLQGGQVAEWVPIISSASGAHIEMHYQVPLPPAFHQDSSDTLTRSSRLPGTHRLDGRKRGAPYWEKLDSRCILAVLVWTRYWPDARVTFCLWAHSHKACQFIVQTRVELAEIVYHTRAAHLLSGTMSST